MVGASQLWAQKIVAPSPSGRSYIRAHLALHPPQGRSQESAAVSSLGTRPRGVGSGARDREGPTHPGVTAGAGPVPGRSRPNPAALSFRLLRAERREAQQA
ncbi:hypothetical protein NDU88_002228 [Pleurodeles waltl]|uniref:Uncharacterized protein n=1 Tax=Pleurodeles waltl TaxID=8319 RepID=A0AAV7TL10_PLEWA|nr:hypothetical protein NDU88_002228 [Pleurodeles waltl]